MPEPAAPASAAATPPHWRYVLLGLAALLLVPSTPFLPVLAPAAQALVLLVPAFAACALAGWWAGGRLSVAIAWVVLAGWVLSQPIPGNAGYGWLVRGWSVLLAGVFGASCVLRPRQPFLAQALPTVAVSMLVGMLAMLTVSGPVAEQLNRTMLAEYADRANQWTVLLDRLTSTPEWTTYFAGSPEALALRQQVLEEYGRMPGRSMTVLPAMLALESLATLAVAWALFQRLARSRIGPPLAPLREFRFSDQLIWGLVVGVTLLVLPAFAEMRDVAVNLLVFFGALYVVRGLGVMSWMLAPRRWTKALLVAVGLLAWQLLATLALALGVGDTWLDWRRRTRPTS